MRKGIIPILLGILLVLSSLGLTAYNIWDSARAEKAAADILEKMREQTDQDPDYTLSLAPPKQDSGEYEDTQKTYADNSMYYRAVMPTLTIDGYEYIGTLEIPAISLQLPVMKEWDYDRLKISPCRYSGSYYTGDLVICGHNYLRHFSPIKGLDTGEDVLFVTADGVVYEYLITNIETIEPTHVEEMIEKEEGKKQAWDLTLFTCNTGGQTRCAVRCVRK